MTNPTAPEPATRLTYFQLAKGNAGKLIQISENDYYYIHDVLPPVYGKGCFAMGEIANHTAQDSLSTTGPQNARASTFASTAPKTKPRKSFNGYPLQTTFT
ncbi:MAG: hypothetical protein ACREBC_30090 [Pyrinomonadaceae bacterium]